MGFSCQPPVPALLPDPPTPPRVPSDARLLADALLQQWAMCAFAGDHGKSDACAWDDCTFTSKLFDVAISRCTK